MPDNADTERVVRIYYTEPSLGLNRWPEFDGESVKVVHDKDNLMGVVDCHGQRHSFNKTGDGWFRTFEDAAVIDGSPGGSDG